MIQIHYKTKKGASKMINVSSHEDAFRHIRNLYRRKIIAIAKKEKDTIGESYKTESGIWQWYCWCPNN